MKGRGGEPPRRARTPDAKRFGPVSPNHLLPMKNRLFPALAAVFLSVCASVHADDGYTTVEGVFDYGFAQSVFKIVNAERTERGFEPLVMTPALTDAVEGTDITWLDITLSYLWWKDAELAGEDTFRGALCDIVVVRPPEPIAGCASMRLWVDRKRGFLRQAEQINEKGERVRWMWVASVGKINDRWMIRNMEVKRPGTGVMTKLHVETLETP